VEGQGSREEERKEEQGASAMPDAKRASAPSAERDTGEPIKQTQPVDRDRRAVRAVDLTDEDIAAIEASEMAPGFEHLNAEVDEG
jgi:hypothetical protein